MGYEPITKFGAHTMCLGTQGHCMKIGSLGLRCIGKHKLYTYAFMRIFVQFFTIYLLIETC